MFSEQKKPQPFLAIWEKATGRLAFLKTTFPISVEDVTWSPNSKSIAAASSTRADFLEIWDVHSATRTHRFRIGGVRIEWDRSASRLFVGGNDRVDLLNIETGRQTTVIEAPAAELSLSPDGHRLALSGTYGDLLLCDIETPAVKKKLTGHSKRVYCLRWSPDGTRLATTADDHTAKVWNAKTGELELDLELSGPAEGVAWTPDGRRLVTAGTLPDANEASEAVIFDARDGTELYRFAPEYDRGGGSVAWGSGGETLAISFERNFAKVYDSNGPFTESLKKHE
jgi:WD40 repeat protein